MATSPTKRADTGVLPATEMLAFTTQLHLNALVLTLAHQRDTIGHGHPCFQKVADLLVEAGDLLNNHVNRQARTTKRKAPRKPWHHHRARLS